MAISNSYPEPNVVTSAVSFRNPQTKALFDPSAVVFKFRDPSGNITTRTYSVSGITKDATGLYRSDITVDQVGKWFYSWDGDGARLESSFEATPSLFA